jgi:hypothetical protein
MTIEDIKEELSLLTIANYGISKKRRKEMFDYFNLFYNETI